jgi:hypothetical protein
LAVTLWNVRCIQNINVSLGLPVGENSEVVAVLRSRRYRAKQFTFGHCARTIVVNVTKFM